MADVPYPQVSNCFLVSTGHIANFEKPTVSPFFCIFLEPIECRCMRACVQQYRLKNYNFTLQALTWSGPDITVITELKKYNYLQQLL